jgi:PAS domain S-box-containing protein
MPSYRSQSGNSQRLSQSQRVPAQLLRAQNTSNPERRSASHLVVMFTLCVVAFSALFIALQIHHVGEAPKVGTKVSRPLNQLAFQLTILSAVQVFCVLFLAVKGREESGCKTQSNEVFNALEPLDASRIIRKRETLSNKEMLQLVHDTAEELRQTKSVQKYLIERASHVVCTLDVNGRFLTVSKAARSTWGYHGYEMEGQSFCDYVPDGREVFTRLLSVTDTNEKVVVESRFQARDGELVDLIWTAYWAKSENAIFCVAQDVTKAKRQEQMRNEFIAMLTHDLKTPLSSLQGILLLLDKGVLGNLNQRGTHLVQSVSSEFDRLQRLIGNMLELEKSDSGNLPLNCSLLPFEEIVGHAAGMLELQAKARDIQIVTVAPHVEVWGDRDQLIRVVLNLLSNAIKFSPSNTTIRLRVEDCGNVVRVSVRDNGRGIPEERRQRIFNRFEQVQIQDAKRNGGTGLGLAICKEIIGKHHGEIGVDSVESIGSDFWFTVPKVDPQHAPNNGTMLLSGTFD